MILLSRWAIPIRYDVQLWHHPHELDVPPWERTGTWTLVSREYKSPSLEQTDRNTHPIPHELLKENTEAPRWEKHPVLKRSIKNFLSLTSIFCPHDGSDGLQIQNQFRNNQDLKTQLKSNYKRPFFLFIYINFNNNLKYTVIIYTIIFQLKTFHFILSVYFSLIQNGFLSFWTKPT